MKKMILICFLAICSSIIHGSDSSGLELQGEIENIMWELGLYEDFSGEIRKIPGIVPKDAEQVRQYIDTLGRYLGDSLVITDYQKAILGHLTFLTNFGKKIDFIKGKGVGFVSLPTAVDVIRESDLTKENVECYIQTYKKILSPLKLK